MSRIPIDNLSSSAGFFLDVRCSWTSVPCIRSHESAGHLVVYFVTGPMVGDRRFPGAILSGSEFLYLFRQPSVSVPPTGSELRDALLRGRFGSSEKSRHQHLRVWSPFVLPFV